ncbi:MAG: hypothetical protein J6Z35_05320, partial [Lachnospiraceae bacterium]|nr:hypothetical protein [Lachnospiraceae bacterium]
MKKIIRIFLTVSGMFAVLALCALLLLFLLPELSGKQEEEINILTAEKIPDEITVEGAGKSDSEAGEKIKNAGDRVGGVPSG